VSESKGVHIAWLVLAVLLFGGVLLWGYLDQNQYFYHVKVARITSSNWPNHQTKECASWNAKTEQPALECDRGHSEVQQVLPVRFYGDTRRDLEPDTVRLQWICQKSEGSHAAITCRAVSPQ